MLMKWQKTKAVKRIRQAKNCQRWTVNYYYETDSNINEYIFKLFLKPCFCGGCPENVGGCCSCPPCFPSKSTVKLENGKTKQMSDLQIGDRVQTGMEKNKVKYRVKYSTVKK